MEFRKYISPATESYLVSNFHEQAQAWLDSFDSNVAALMDRWETEFACHEGDSRFGAILYGRSAKYGDVAIKIIPVFSERLKGEIECYRRLKYPEMCRLYDVDTRVGALLLKQIQVDFESAEDIKLRMFKTLHQNRVKGGAKEFPLYSDVVKSVLANALKEVGASNDEALKLFEPSIYRALDTLDGFMDAEIYLVHGDAHGANMLISGGNCVLIDPLGYNAPFEIEYSRYLGSAIKFTNMTPAELAGIMDKMLPENADFKRALDAFAIDTTLRGCNTFIEGDTPEAVRYGAVWADNAWNLREKLLKGI